MKKPLLAKPFRDMLKHTFGPPVKPAPVTPQVMKPPEEPKPDMMGLGLAAQKIYAPPGAMPPAKPPSASMQDQGTAPTMNVSEAKWGKPEPK